VVLCELSIVPFALWIRFISLLSLSGVVIISRRQGRGAAGGWLFVVDGTGEASLVGPLLASARNSVTESVRPLRFFSPRLLPRVRPRCRPCESGARGFGDLQSPGCLAGSLACSGPALAARRPQAAEHRLSPSAASFRSRVRRAMSRGRFVPAIWERRRVPAGVSRRAREVCSFLSKSKFGAFTSARRARGKLQVEDRRPFGSAVRNRPR
jgi:hypothetical protein